jgi:hypothetical protein
MIKPTIGRKVWFWPAKVTGGHLVVNSRDQPLDATVVYVFNDRLVNLQIIDHGGYAHPATSVPLIQEGDERPDGYFAEWMPFQKGQAARTEQAEAKGEDAARIRLDAIARVCHEANRALCQAFGDNTQLPWEQAPEWQRASARMGVDLHLMGDFGPEASHVAWMSQKQAEGWTYGELKDTNAKTHPCMVPFAELPRHQQAKDYVFRAVVHAMKA